LVASFVKHRFTGSSLAAIVLASARSAVAQVHDQLDEICPRSGAWREYPPTAARNVTRRSRRTFAGDRSRASLIQLIVDLRTPLRAEAKKIAPRTIR